MKEKLLTPLLVILYGSAIAYIAIIDIMSLVYINNVHGLVWALGAVFTGVGLIVAPFFAELGWWYAPVLILFIVLTGVKDFGKH